MAKKFSELRKRMTPAAQGRAARRAAALISASVLRYTVAEVIARAKRNRSKRAVVSLPLLQAISRDLHAEGRSDG